LVRRAGKNGIAQRGKLYGFVDRRHWMFHRETKKPIDRVCRCGLQSNGRRPSKNLDCIPTMAADRMVFQKARASPIAEGETATGRRASAARGTNAPSLSGAASTRADRNGFHPATSGAVDSPAGLRRSD
jgi:hypothetical protein